MSSFITPPSSKIPLVLLPVRLETRFQSGQLWLRVFPDDIHVNSFEPKLTAEEQAAKTAYLAIAATDVVGRQAAFASLVGQFGDLRAAWLSGSGPLAGPTSSLGPQAAIADALPERWIVITYQGGLRQVTSGPLIQQPLALALSPTGGGPSTDSVTAWISNFDRAVDAGMAFRIPLTGSQTRGFSRIVVLGLRSTLNPRDSAAQLAALLEAHHYTDGLELLPHNTPTNNTDDVSSGLTTKDMGSTQLFAVEQGSPLCPARPTADGDRLARALGIPPETFAHVRGADGAQDEQAGALNTVLWPATWGYYLSQVVTGAVPTPEVMLPAARDHFIKHVRARGHFPTLRVGQQPYGVLPVCWNAQWKSLDGLPLDGPLSNLLGRLREIFSPSIQNVPRLPHQDDPEAQLVSLLGMTPASTSMVARGMIGPEYNYAFWNFIQQEVSKDWWSALAQKTRADSSDLAAILAGTRLAYSTYVSWHRPISDVLVAPDPLDSVVPAPFLVSLSSLDTWESWQSLTPPQAPIPVLFLLLRHAVLRAYMDTALDLLAADTKLVASERIEAELVAFENVPLRSSAWDLLNRKLNTGKAVGELLDSLRNDKSVLAFSNFWGAFARLTTLSQVELDSAARESLDLASYRLDAWITSLAHFRLDQLRCAEKKQSGDPNAGIVLGGYGWLEDVRPQPSEQQLASAPAFIHAPSLNQATTAAVLRSGYLSHQADPANPLNRPFEIDLSSARVRLALHLLDGIREGQSLSALLGYRLERMLHDNGVDALVATLRHQIKDGDTSALDVVDGLKLFRAAANPNFLHLDWVVALPKDQLTGLQAGLELLRDAIDSVADVTLSESVHQLVRGNTVRAAATLDSIARGDTLPPELDLLQTPRSGTAFTYRLITAATAVNAPGWTVTPRAQAEPRLNAWAAALLGDPALVRIRVRFLDPAGTLLGTNELGLNQLELAPIDLLSLPETKGVTGELADRIRRVAYATHAATGPAEMAIELDTARDPAWKPQTIALTEWLALLQAIARLVGGARPLELADLAGPDVVPSASDANEQSKAAAADLLTRAEAAALQLGKVLKLVESPGALDTALMEAAAFGIVGSVPAVDASLWPSQLAAVLDELVARSAALDKLAQPFVRDSSQPDVSRAYDLARLKLIFGDSFVVLQVLSPALAAQWPQLWQDSLSLQGGEALASVSWLQRVSRVRAGAGRFDHALLLTEALAGRPVLDLDVAQLPYAAGDRWVGLGSQTATPTGRISLVSFSPSPYITGAAIAGLMIDEWIDVWPSNQQVTGVSFQYADPVSRAPQAILLAVPADDAIEWTLEAVEGSILEALSLAKLRGVDPDVVLGTVPPQPVDTSVISFQALSDTLVAVLDSANNLWLEHGPFGRTPPIREQIDANVSAFQALTETEVVILDKNGKLWLAQAPFGFVPPSRKQIDANVALFPPVPPPPPPPPPPPKMIPVPDVTGLPQATVGAKRGASDLVVAAGFHPIFVPPPPLQGSHSLVPIVKSQKPTGVDSALLGSDVYLYLAYLTGEQ